MRKSHDTFSSQMLPLAPLCATPVESERHSKKRQTLKPDRNEPVYLALTKVGTGRATNLYPQKPKKPLDLGEPVYLALTQVGTGRVTHL